MEYNNYLGWIYPKTKDIVSSEDVSNIIQLQKGQPGGIATLDGTGKVPSDQLPSYVDDVLQFESIDVFPSQGETDKIYLDTQTNLSYRWTGSTYLLIGGLSNLVNGRADGSMRGIYAKQEDGNYSLGSCAVALNSNSQASGALSYAEGENTTASGDVSHAEGTRTTASGPISHAEGSNTTASGSVSHAEGEHTIALGNISHAEGEYTTASGAMSHTEGQYTTTNSNAIGSHAEGKGYSSEFSIQANGAGSHAEGYISGPSATIIASGVGSHAEGLVDANNSILASGSGSHAEGNNTQATGSYAHAEGSKTTASGPMSHAEGNQTTASGINSHAGGTNTTAQRKSQTVIGEYNKLDTQGTTTTRGKYVFIVGNGTGTNNRSNALAVTWDGNVQAAGTPNAANHLATKSYVDTNIIDLESQIQTLGASIGSISPIVCFAYDITNGQTPSIDFSYADIESAMAQNKIVFIVYKQVITEGSFIAQHISQTRVTECNMYVTEGTPSYRVYTEDSQMQFIASSDSQFMTIASSSQIDPDPSDRDPGDFS